MKNYSVLMSVYYKEKPEWLEASINSMLEQTVRTNNFVIVKDGILGDDLERVLSNFDKKYPNLFTFVSLKENKGLGLALAEGIKYCNNELIARMDSDDISKKDRCERQLKCFEKDDKLQIVGCYEAEFIDSIENIKAIHKVPEKNEEIIKFMRRRCALLHPTVIFKKSAVLKYGNYQHVKQYEDYDLFARMVFGGCKSYNLQETLYYIRINPEFYKRRGGIEYLITAVKFKNKLRKNKNISNLDFIISAGGQSIVCLLPNKLRELIYMTFLR